MAIIFVLLFWIPNLSASSLPADDFLAGLQQLQEKNYSHAAELFQKEYAAGKSFPALYYNWGHAAYYQRQLGLAVGLWRRALYMDPELSAANQALAYIAGELPRDIAANQLSGWRGFQVHVLDRVGIEKLLAASWLLFVITGFLLIRFWAAYVKALRAETPKPKTPTIAVALAIMFLTSAMLSVAKGVSLFESRATVVSKEVALRTGPNENDNVIFDLFEGLDVSIQQVQNSWALVTIGSGASGWVPTTALFQHTGRNNLW